MKVVVLTTSYPSPEHPVAGTFVAAYVEAARTAGVDVEVVHPGTFRHFGLALGAGIVQNLRAAPWRVALVPAFLVSFALAARRAAGDADVVHAHWIPSAVAARVTGKPYVLQVWGTDVALARRAPWVVRRLLGRARLVIAASRYLADAAVALGARAVEVVAAPLDVPSGVPEPADPPHVLFVGRLSEEKGILDFIDATAGLPRTIVGDGPLRGRVPDALGFVTPAEVSQYYARAAVVCVPSRREGYGMTAREALAHGRPVVVTRVGGLNDLGAGVVSVDAGDVPALRAAVTGLLDDEPRRRVLGAEGRAAALSTSGAGEALADIYVSSSR